MKHITKKVCVLLAVCILTSLLAVPAAAKTYSWSSLKISSRKTLKTYLSSGTSATTYTTKDLTTASGSIDVSTELIISSIKKNSAGTWYAYLKKQKAYIPLSALTTATDSFIGNFKTSSKIKKLYRRRSGSRYGSRYISKKQTAYIVDTKTSDTMAQVIYPISGGWNMVWVKYSDFASVKLNKTSASIYTGSTGNTLQLSAKMNPSIITGKYTYSSSNTAVATVSSTGLVTAVAAGSATITVTDSVTSRSATCKIKVKSPYIKLNASSAKLTAGKTKQLKASFKPSGSTTAASWTSSDTAVATVSSSGLVTAVNAGTATITASVNGYTSATCKITVVAWQWPVKNKSTQRSFGSYSKTGKAAGTPYHAGLDLKGSSTIYAAAAGKVMFKGCNTSSGYYVILQHTIDGTTVYSLYSHLKNYTSCPDVNATVTAGQKIGVMGNTRSTHGTHLHFSIFTEYSQTVSSYAAEKSSANILKTSGNTFYNPTYIIKYQKLPAN